MAATAVGSRIIVRATSGTHAPLVLRALRAIELDGGWAVPVMGDIAALATAGVDPGLVQAEFSTSAGLLCLDAEIHHSAGTFVIRAPGLRTAVITEQRRENVRAAVALPVRGAVLGGGAGDGDAGDAADGQVTRQGGPSGPREVLEGTTRTVSAGGLSVAFGSLPAAVRPGSQLYLELRMPGGDLAPAVVSVVERQEVRTGTRVRVRFLDISPLDSERLVRMVFARQRAELAERRGTLRT